MDEQSIKMALISGAARAVVGKIIEVILEALKRTRGAKGSCPDPTSPRPPTAKRRIRAVYRCTYLDR